jgi:hypothetical protein
MTGRNVRHFADVVDLVAALRLRSADPGVE